MDVFKKLTVRRRRNSRSGSIVSDDDDADFCYHESKAVIVEKSNDLSGGNTVSLYGRRNTERPADSCPSKMAVVTSSKFDSDEIFLSVAQAIINQYQNENMSEREAICYTINNPDDLMSFIEALDLRYIVFASQNTDGMESTGDDDTLSEIVVKARSIFDTTLKAMWREYETLSSPRGTTGHEGGFKQHREEMINLDDEYNKHHPKTPKNLRMSPMRTSSFNYRNHGFISQSESIDSACSEGSNGSMFRPFKRPRRWFFPQNKSESLAAPLFSSTSAKIVPETHNSSTMKPVLPKFHFNFGKNNNLDNIAAKKNSMLFGDLSRGPTAVQSLQLDGTSSYGSLGHGNGSVSTYVPPTSPIRSVSLEMGIIGNSNATTAMG